jgi:hypothetical protein
VAKYGVISLDLDQQACPDEISSKYFILFFSLFRMHLPVQLIFGGNPRNIYAADFHIPIILEN